MNTEKILISVIIPVYNVENYLNECLDSVLNQTFREIEVICIDDGSSDKSMEILQEYSKQDLRIKILTQNNMGAGVARNRGLTIAKGEYLAFLDSDDIFRLDMLEKNYNTAVEKNCDIVICNYNKYDTKTKQYDQTNLGILEKFFCDKDIFSYKDMPLHIFSAFKNITWNKFLNKNFVIDNEIKFQELFRTNDLLFTLTALISAERITIINEYLIDYRVNMTTNSQATNHKYPLDFYKAFLACKNMLLEKGVFTEVERTFFNTVLGSALYNLRTHNTYDGFKIVYEKIAFDLESDFNILSYDSTSYPKTSYDTYLEIREKSIDDYISSNNIKFCNYS